MLAMAIDKNWCLAPHLAVINDALLDLVAGEFDRLAVFCPPRHGKSQLCSRFLPSWYLNAFPDKKVILCGYGDDFASFWGRQVRNTIKAGMEDGILRVQIAKDSSAADRWEIQGHSGGMITAGVGGAITGKGGDLIIIDDPVKSREEAESKTYRNRIWDWYRSDLRTRLEPGAKVLIIQTRWHKDDLSGRLLEEKSEPFKIIKFPALATSDDVLGRKPGDALWPDRFGRETLLKIKGVIGSYAFESLYQQNPYIEEGEIFKREWWRYYDVMPMEKPIRVVQSWDTAFKKDRVNDECACTTWMQLKCGFFLLDGISERMEYPALKEAVKMQAAIHSPDVILIEDKASGQSLIPDLKSETILPIIAVQVDSDKTTRAHSATPMIQAGNVHLPRSKAITGRIVDQCAAFPRDKHDDIVDTVTQFINWVKRQATGTPVITTRAEPVDFTLLPRAPMSHHETTITRPKARFLLRGY